MFARVIAGLLFVVWGVSASSAQTPLGTEFTYQGVLKDGGNPANGLYDVQFRLYDAATEGKLIAGPVCINNVDVREGLFTVVIDFGGDAFAGEDRFLEIDVRPDAGLDCDNPAGYVTLAPRQALTAAPNALFSLNADTLDGLDSSEFLRSVPVPLTLSGASPTSIIQGTNSSASNSSAGVLGRASSASGTTTGVSGQTDSLSGSGVFGLATSALGTNYGGRFETISSRGIAVFGLAGSGAGTSYGGRSETVSPSGVGALGRGGVGLFGESIRDGVGVSAFGVYGLAAANSGTVYGVYGFTPRPQAGYGVYAQGNLGASGTKSFRIDHPSDPTHKYLLHYSAESPEVINFYSGKVTLDAQGEAVVELPAYFASVNRDPRYTLTAMGAPMPMLHVAGEISEEALRAGEQAGPGVAPPTCSFRIAGGVPGKKVSWEVKAVRNDRFVREYGAPVESEKRDPERGKYQNPELYCLPPEMGMDYRPEVDRSDRQRPSPGASHDATAD